MMRTNLTTLSLLPVAALVCAAPAYAQSINFAGTWETNFGVVTLMQDGTMVSGSYNSEGPATLTGAIRGRMLSFTYKEANGGTGKGEFILASDGKSFRGRWVSKSQMGPWNGKKQGADTPEPEKPLNRTGPYKVGDRVEVWHNGDGQFRWMVSTILEIPGEGQYKIHYGGSQYNVTTVTEDRIYNEAREKAKEQNKEKWPLLQKAMQPYHQILESFAHEHNPKWSGQGQLIPGSPAELQKALSDMAAVETLITGKFAGMTAVSAGFDDSIMQHPEAWLEIARNRKTLAQGLARKVVAQHIAFSTRSLAEIAEQVPQQDGFGLKKVGLDLVIGKREAVKAKALAPLKSTLESVGLSATEIPAAEWDAAANAIVAAAKKTALTARPSATYTNAAFEAQVRSTWTRIHPERKIVSIKFSRAGWNVTTNALGTPLYRHYGGMVRYKLAGFDYAIEEGFQRREDYQGGGKYTYRPMAYESELRIVKG